jgi:peptidoglycan/xylan/chitin deacetylase (PgdA/CDA1 family)
MAFMKKNTFPILTYHSIDTSCSVISVSPSSFKEQMSYLKERGYETLSLQEVTKYVKEGSRLLEKRFVITFDDGYKNNYTQAFPILKEYQFTATIFLTTSYCGMKNDWPNQHSSIPNLPMLSWEEIREMSKYGIEFGAHTRSHPRLTELTIEKAKLEMLGSKRDIEAHLDKPVEFFSYPFGNYDEKIKEIAKTAFKGAISNRPGKVDSHSDPYALERINATGQIFKCLPLNILSIRSFDLYVVLKRAVNRVTKLKQKY